MTRPNIVWLVADHFAWHNHRQYLNLPNYDRIASEGVAFDRAYAVTPQCQPARGAMLTGKYPHRSGMVLNDGKSGTKREFDANDQLISAPLLDAGYRCGYFGKWHCGRETRASDFGFEGWSLPGYGHPYLSKAYADYLSDQGLPAPRVEIDCDLGNSDNGGRTFDLTQHGWGPFAAGGRFLTPIETHEAFFVAHLAKRWLEGLSGDAPFFLRVDVWGPHHPYHSAGRFAGSVAPEDIAEYPSFRQTYEDLPLTYESCRRRWNRGPDVRDWSKWQVLMARCYEQAMLVDAAFGLVLDTLEQRGLLDDSLVIMNADHGDLTGTHGNMFNKDSLMVEEVLRIPLAIRPPAGTVGGTQTDALVSNLDLPATVLDAAQLSTAAMDGASLLPLALGQTVPWRTQLMCEHHGGFRLEHVQRCLISERYKYVAHLEDYDELYDLVDDPYEMHNLFRDPAARDQLSAARRDLAEIMRRTQDNSESATQLLAQLAS